MVGPTVNRRIVASQASHSAPTLGLVRRLLPLSVGREGSRKHHVRRVGEVVAVTLPKLAPGRRAWPAVGE